MSNVTDGGPAFPYSALSPEGPHVYKDNEGMSLRDWFAGQALMGFVLAHCIADGPNMTVDDIATASVKVADAMLKVREQ